MLANKKLIWLGLLILVILIGYLVYSMFSSGGPTTNLTSTGNEDLDVAVVASDIAPAAGETTGGAAESFIQILSSLRDVKLAGGIFNDPIFTTYLQDFSRPLPERQAGRINPFAPLNASELTKEQPVASTTP